MFVIANILCYLLDIYFWIVLIAVILTWVHPDPYNPVVRFIQSLTEPVFYRVRQWLPFTYSPTFDFSPVVVLVAIGLLERIIQAGMIQTAALR